MLTVASATRDLKQINFQIKSRSRSSDRDFLKFSSQRQRAVFFFIIIADSIKDKLYNDKLQLWCYIS